MTKDSSGIHREYQIVIGPIFDYLYPIGKQAGLNNIQMHEVKFADTSCLFISH